MDAHLKVAVVQFAEAEGVVKVLCVRRVDGKGEHFAEVTAAGAVLVRNLVRDGVGGIFHLFLELVREAELGKDGVHLRLVIPGHSQHVHHVSVRGGRASFPAVHDCGHLHTLYATFRYGHLNVVGHCLGAHKHPRLTADNVQYPHKGPAAALDYGDYFTAAALGLAGAFLRHGHLDGVPVKRPAGFGSLHIYILFLPLNAHKDKALAGHYGRPDVFGHPLGRFLFALVLVLILSFGHNQEWLVRTFIAPSGTRFTEPMQAGTRTVSP